MPVNMQVTRVACAVDWNDQLHVCMVDGDRGLWHTLRKPDMSWLPLVNVQQVTGGPPVDFVGCAAEYGWLHICVDGLWHTEREADGPWPFGWDNVQEQTQLHGPFIPGDIVGVSCAQDESWRLHLCAINVDGNAFGLWHTERDAPGQFEDPNAWPHGFENLQSSLPAGAPTVTAVEGLACAALTELDVLVIDGNGKLWYARRASEPWGAWLSGWDDVQSHTSQHGPDRGFVSDVAVAVERNVQAGMHVCILGEGSQLFHTLRDSQGNWNFGFGDVQSQTGRFQSRIGPFDRVACAADGPGNLHVLVIDQQFVLWHTMRTPDGNWPFPFRPVLQAIPQG